MNAQQLLDELTVPEGLPRDALAWADAHRDELVPVFLDFLRRYIDEPDEPEVPTPLFYVMHLLGSWREKSAYRPMAEVLRSDPERLAWDLSDSITESVPRLMRNVFDGDPAPLYEVIEHETGDEFLRGPLLLLVTALAVDEELPREAAVGYLRDAYSSLRPQSESHIWACWAQAVAILGLQEMSTLVERVFERGFINPISLTREDFQEDLRIGISNPRDPEFWAAHPVDPFGNIIEELETWAFAAMDDDDAEEKEVVGELESLFDSYLDDAIGEPARNPHRHVGRNDPCPCGSGKKYKKCCLTLHESGARQ
jgi:hypothetical protein